MTVVRGPWGERADERDINAALRAYAAVYRALHDAGATEREAVDGTLMYLALVCRAHHDPMRLARQMAHALRHMLEGMSDGPAADEEPAS